MFRQTIALLSAITVAIVSLTSLAMAQTVIIGHFGSPTPMQVAAAENASRRRPAGTLSGANLQPAQM